MYLCQSRQLWGVNHACLITLDSEMLHDDDTIEQIDGMSNKPNRGQQRNTKTMRETVISQLHEAGIRSVKSARSISENPYYSSVAGRKNQKALVIQ